MKQPIFYVTANPVFAVSAILAGVLILAAFIYLICGTRKTKLTFRHKGIAIILLVVGIVALPVLGVAQIHTIHSQFHSWVNKNYHLSLTQQEATNLFDYSADGITVKGGGKTTRLVYETYKDGHTVKETTVNK